VLSLTAMDRILEIDRASQLAVVEPGVINASLAQAARAQGLWYAPDPASWEFSTLGGNVATNAGGLCCVKYGVTRESVLGLEVVLADGEVLRTGARTVKRVAGYDLTRLFVGSEGTLGVITEITLRLRPTRAPSATLVAAFATLEAAGHAIAAIVARVTPSLLELMDQRTLQAVEAWKPMGLPIDGAAMLFARSDAGSDAAAEVATMAEACQAAGATLLATSGDAVEGEQLMAARRLAYPALERLGATLLDDVGVPLAQLPPLLSAIERIAAEQAVTIGTFGHAGDGNLHPTIVFDASDSAAVARARAAFAAIVRAALALGGTVSGEHGIGLLKRELLADELGAVGLRVQRAIKQALDPRGILNPGKILSG
jgi:glycolate oxidase